MDHVPRGDGPFARAAIAGNSTAMPLGKPAMTDGSNQGKIAVSRVRKVALRVAADMDIGLEYRPLAGELAVFGFSKMARLGNGVGTLTTRGRGQERS